MLVIKPKYTRKKKPITVPVEPSLEPERKKIKIDHRLEPERKKIKIDHLINGKGIVYE